MSLSDTPLSYDTNAVAETLVTLFTDLAQDWETELPRPLRPELDLIRDCGCTSLDVVIFLGLVQRHYGRPIPFEELFATNARRTGITIAELSEFIASRVAVPVAPLARATHG